MTSVLLRCVDVCMLPALSHNDPVSAGKPITALRPFVCSPPRNEKQKRDTLRLDWMRTRPRVTGSRSFLNSALARNQPCALEEQSSHYLREGVFLASLYTKSGSRIYLFS